MAPRNLPRTCGNALALPFSRHGLDMHVTIENL